MAAWVREEENASNQRQKKREAEEADKVEVAPGVTVASLRRFRTICDDHTYIHTYIQKIVRSILLNYSAGVDLSLNTYKKRYCTISQDYVYIYT